MVNTGKSLRDSLEETANVIKEHGASFQLSQSAKHNLSHRCVHTKPPASTQPGEESLV